MERPRTSRLETRKGQWARLSELLSLVERSGRGALSPDELAELGRLHRKVSSHLAQAQAGASDPEAVAFLNGLVVRSHNTIYRVPSGFRPMAVLDFLFAGYPRIVCRLWPYVLLATVAMYGTATYAFVVTLADPTYANLFVPAPFLAAAAPTEGERPEIPPAIMGALSGFIMQNNIKVGRAAFAGGLLGGTVTMYHMIQNGAMVGGLAGAVQHYGNPKAFYALIVPHGVIELTAIVLMGAAGFRLGWSILAPGRLSYRLSIARGAREAGLLALGTVPLFVVAALIEGFVTPAAWLGEDAKLWLGAATGVALLAYLCIPRGRGPEPDPDQGE